VTKTGIGLTIGFITLHNQLQLSLSGLPRPYNSRPNISQLCSHCIHRNRSSGILCQHYPGCRRTPGSLPSFLGGYKVEDKLYLGIREQKRLNTAGLEQCFSNFLSSRHNVSPSGILRHTRTVGGSTDVTPTKVDFRDWLTLKIRNGSDFFSLDQELRVCLSAIRPRIKQLCKSKQVHISHWIIKMM
jgi:hypothetical protein